MKFNGREAATNKQYQEILLWLDEKPDEFTPLKTAKASVGWVAKPNEKQPETLIPLLSGCLPLQRPSEI